MLHIAVVILLLSSFFQAGANQKYNYIIDKNEVYSVPGEFFPSCVEVIDVWPPPNSVLKPIHLPNRFGKNPGRAHYLFRLTFSRPVAIGHIDTTAGWQPEIAHTPFKGGWFHPKGSVPDALFRLDEIAPVFLTPSQTAVERYYAFRVVNWHGSSREFLFYFTLPTEEHGPNLRLSQQVHLVVDGGRFYSFEKVGPVRHPIYVPTTIIGDYYFDEYLKKNTWFTPKPRLLLKASPYCKQREPRPFFVNRTHVVGAEMQPSEKEEKMATGVVWLNEDSHEIVREEHLDISSTQDDRFVLHLSLTTNNVGGKHTLPLPPTVKALYKGNNVTVKLPMSATITVNQPLTPSNIFVPVRRTPIYELRERIYHNGPKIAILEFPPAFTSTNLTDNQRDILDGLFPERGLYSSKVLNINIEVVDKGTGIKLAQYFPIWEWFPSGQLKEDYFPKMAWMELTRNAPVASKPKVPRYRPGIYTHGIVPLSTAAKFLQNNSRICPGDSKRNPGRRGGTIDHVIEYGPLFHLLEPLPSETWSVEEKSVEVTMTDNKGTKIPVSLSSVHPGVSANVPSSIVEGLKKYRCLLSPIKDIPKPKHSRVVNEKWVHLDSCIFVPTSIAESRQCGGLGLFRNVFNIVNDPQFCRKKFGECIGLPFSSPYRFPSIPTFGLQELTGWIPCSSDQCPLNEYQQHPVGQHVVQGDNTKAMPKAILKFSKTLDTPASSHDDIVMQLTPSMNSETRTDYTLVVSRGIEILEPVLSSQSEGSTNPHSEHGPLEPKDCDTVWRLHTEALNISSTHVSDLRLTAAVYNTGEGGGDLVFDVKCTDKLIVHPSSGVINIWIDPLSSVIATFTLSGELASSLSKTIHKCEFVIRPQPPPRSSEDEVEVASLSCSKWITTFNGAFEDPCLFKADTPSVDLMYFVLPRNKVDHSLSLQHLLDSPFGDYLEVVKAITISLMAPYTERQLLRTLQELRISCQSNSIIVLQERQLLHEAIMSSRNFSYSMDRTPYPVVISGDFTANRRVYFFATRPWIESQSTESPHTSSCEMVLVASQPNWICNTRAEVVERINIPLVKADIEAIKRAGTFSHLYPLYGKHSDLVMMFLCLCVVLGLLFVAMVSLGAVCMFVCRKKLPKRATLEKLRDDLEKAKKEDKKYWENPQMYLCSLAMSKGSQPSADNCEYYGEEFRKPHFILHQWRATDSIDTDGIKHLKIAGTLKYKTQELQVMFGHIKKVHIHKDGSSANIWIQASSGMYLLPVSTVSLDYLPTHAKVCKKHGVDKRCFEQLTTILDSKELEEDGQVEEPVEEVVHSGNENDQLLLDF